MKISIVTINLNNLNGLKNTLTSVANQGYDNIEYIVIDGASIDGSVDTIKANQTNITSWLSEPDSGIYNAMNKGIEIATGDYLLFLNSGDILYNESVIAEFVKVAQEKKDLYSGTIAFDKHDRRNYEQAPEKLTFGFFFENTLRHPCTFIKRTLFEQFGTYNEANKIVSDWEFFLKVSSRPEISYQKLHFPIALFDVTGIGNSPESHSLIAREQKQFLEKEFTFFYVDYLRSKEIEGKYMEIVNSRAHAYLSKILKRLRK